MDSQWSALPLPYSFSIAQASVLLVDVAEDVISWLNAFNSVQKVLASPTLISELVEVAEWRGVGDQDVGVIRHGFPALGELFRTGTVEREAVERVVGRAEELDSVDLEMKVNV